MAQPSRIQNSGPVFAFIAKKALRLLEDPGAGDESGDVSNATDFGNSTLVAAEEEHAHDAITTLYLNVTIIGCLLLAYYVKRHKIYHLPESAGAMLVGVVVGGIARLSTDKLTLFEFVSYSFQCVCVVM